MIHVGNADHRECNAQTKKRVRKLKRKWLAEASHDTGDWSNGMIGVSKTFGGSSILSSPVMKGLEMLEK